MREHPCKCSNMSALKNLCFVGSLLFLKFVVVCGYNYETRYFLTKVDHFSYANADTFNLRYLVAEQYWNSSNSNAPIFFYTGNEGIIDKFANATGLMWEWASEFGAYLIFAEHRYYGESLPYGEKSFDSPAQFGYLTSEQALADYADLIFNLKQMNPALKDSPVVTFGGSVGGMLAAWFRIKYPHLIKAYAFIYFS